ncbi:MAG: tetraacyldisaccharide 4'-kinase [Gammaproteobacteria bacterium]
MRAAIERWLLARWFGKPGVLWLLLPLEWLYRLVVAWRGSPTGVRPPVPVIVVGNLAVGGSGKTPLVLALVAAVRQQGLRPGVIARGHGGRGPFPLKVGIDTAAAASGDEPLLVARRHQGVPVFVAPDRRAALAAVLAEGVDVVISDDGLQHLSLQRSVEIAVVDGRRGLGNGRCLPVGPLREPPARLSRVDFVVVNGGECPSLPVAAVTSMRLQPALFRRVGVPAETLDPAAMRARCVAPPSALAGIGDPSRFFATLQSLGIDAEGHPFGDHHAYTVDDLRPFAGRLLLMTEKDAVKCADLVAVVGIDAWYLEVDAVLPAEFFSRVFARAVGNDRS